MKNYFNRLKAKLILRSKKGQIKLLRNSPVDWKAYADKHSISEFEAVQFFLENFRLNPLCQNGWFDTEYYLKRYPDINNSQTNPLVHFLLFGQKENRKAYDLDDVESALVDNKDQDKALAHLLQKSTLIKNSVSDPLSKLEINNIVDDSNRGVAVIKNIFDQQLYERLYPDVKAAPINSMLHFLRNSEKEGRVGWLEFEDVFLEGKKIFDPNLENVLVVSHDASFTGAPVVALEAANRLSKEFNVISMTLREGPLADRFIETSVCYVDCRMEGNAGVYQYIFKHLQNRIKIEKVLLNSAETVHVLNAIKGLELPTVSLIHEYAEYTRPIGKISLNLYQTNLAVYPAKSLLDSGLHELKSVSGAKQIPNNLTVRPQGYLDFSLEGEGHSEWSLRKQLGLKESDFIIIGAGHVQARKGLDWFFATCNYLYQLISESDPSKADRLHFVWLGGGYDFEKDVNLSNWIHTFIIKNGISDRSHFPGMVSGVHQAMSEADIYLLSSKLDPFPNVAIDALNNDCGMAVFEGSSGIYDFLSEHDLRYVSASYGDCYGMAQSIESNFDSLVSRNGINQVACETYLDMNDYVKFVSSQLRFSKNIELEVQDVLETNETFNSSFDSTFYSRTYEGGRPAYHFLSMLHKGLVFRKPFAGSNIQTLLKEEPKIEGESFADFVTRMMAPEPSSNVTILSGIDSKEFQGKVAVHFHIYYADLIPEYTNYFKTLCEHEVDLLVTSVPDLDEQDRELLQQSVTGRLIEIETDNLGRDVYPFHKLILDGSFDQYDVIGHFHTKKSKDVNSKVGESWRKFLLSNLLGSKNAVSEILNLFAESNVGLVYAEDPNCPDIGGNQEYAESLCKSMGLKMPDSFEHFPLGTMFWASPKGLSKLKGLALNTFALAEPVPYDGSILHAFERLVPEIVKSEGYAERRVYTANTTR